MFYFSIMFDKTSFMYVYFMYSILRNVIQYFIWRLTQWHKVREETSHLANAGTTYHSQTPGLVKKLFFWNRSTLCFISQYLCQNQLRANTMSLLKNMGHFTGVEQLWINNHHSTSKQANCIYKSISYLSKSASLMIVLFKK